MSVRIATQTTPQFSEIFQDARFVSVDPRACVPLTKSRELHRFGINQMKRSLTGKFAQVDPCAPNGFVTGSDAAVVVEMTGMYRMNLLDHFREDGMTEEEVKARVDSRTVWYGIVDGRYRHLCITELIDEDPERWEHFTWPVILLQSRHSLQRLKQLARSQNGRNSEHVRVEVLFCDLLIGLKEESDRLTKEANGKRPTAAAIVQAYDGSSGKNESTLKQTASTAVRMDWSVIRMIATIMTAEHPELCNKGKDPQPDALIDTRVFKKFVNVSSLKSATVFMNANTDTDIQAQVNTILRARTICRNNGFKAVSAKVISSQYTLAKLAQEETIKFLNFIAPDPWPKELNVVRDNLLTSTVLDEEVEVNKGNSDCVIPALLECYQRNFPSAYEFKCGRKRQETLNAAKEAATEAGQAHSEVTPTMTDVPSLETEHQLKEAKAADPTESIEGRDDATVNSTDDESIDPSVQLAAKGIRVHRMRWQDYDKQVCNDQDDELADLILTEPPP